MAGIYYFFLITRKKIAGGKVNEALRSNNEIAEYPFLTSLFVVLNIGQFFFTVPPFVLQGVLWLLMSFSLIIIHRKTPGMFGSRLWLFLLLFFILVVADNLILESSDFEKWFLMIISFLSVAMALRFTRHRRKILREIPVAKWILFMFIILESIAFISIIFGRYNLCKTLFTSGYFAVITGIFLYWTYHFLLKALNTYTETVAPYNARNVFVKLKMSHDKMPRVYKGIFYFGWSVLFLRNFYFYTVITSFFNDIFYDERSIGKYSFTLETIFIFVFILFLSGLLAKLISFLTDNSTQIVSGPYQKKGGISNWLLLIRLAIIITGVILAFAAAGIPMDRLTIIIGTLGLGIGFGLQNLVSNLISGVMLAFERPIEIGDQIEVAGRTGRIKEIGIRSSKMVSLDGAEVIIPNGDLISQHVINWTLSNNHRRVEIIVGVKYGTDLHKAKQFLEGILKSNNRVKQAPAPVVLLHQLNNSSIDFRLLFWADINVWLDAKSEIIMSIDKIFKEEGIEIPFPQQDVYIKELPDTGKEENKNQ
jgi:small-conductance mechanosensitive channel